MLNVSFLPCRRMTAFTLQMYKPIRQYKLVEIYLGTKYDNLKNIFH